MNSHIVAKFGKKKWLSVSGVREEKPQVHKTRPRPYFPHFAVSQLKFCDHWCPFICANPPDLVWTGWGMPELFLKVRFFDPKSHYNIG